MHLVIDIECIRTSLLKFGSIYVNAHLTPPVTPRKLLFSQEGSHTLLLAAPDLSLQVTPGSSCSLSCIFCRCPWGPKMSPGVRPLLHTSLSPPLSQDILSSRLRLAAASLLVCLLPALPTGSPFPLRLQSHPFQTKAQSCPLSPHILPETLHLTQNKSPRPFHAFQPSAPPSSPFSGITSHQARLIHSCAVNVLHLVPQVGGWGAQLPGRVKLHTKFLKHLLMGSCWLVQAYCSL